MKEFKLWLEFEEVDPQSWNKQNDFTNIQVDLADGRKYGINVWTFQYFQTAILQEKAANSSSAVQFIIPPDLFVEELTRSCIQESISELLKIGDLDRILNPSVLIKN